MCTIMVHRSAVQFKDHDDEGGAALGGVVTSRASRNNAGTARSNSSKDCGSWIIGAPGAGIGTAEGRARAIPRLLRRSRLR